MGKITMSHPEGGRRPYTHGQLERLLAPRSIAVVGVSANPAGFGSITLANLTAPGRFDGPVYRVHSRLETLDGHPCYPSVAALPQAPDCVFVAAPRASVPAVVRDCAQRGAGGLVLYASGYAETGLDDRQHEQQALVDMVRVAGMPLLGPNCMGYANYGLGIVGSFAQLSFNGRTQRPAIGLVSQSGALAGALAQALEHGVTLSHMLTCGNAGDVDVADLVHYLAADPLCSAVACVLEGMTTPERLLQATAACRAAGKPLVVHKLGSSERGARAAASHTGSVAGSHAAYRAALTQAGAMVVDEIEALIDTCSFFAKAGRPQARGVAVASVSGGACILLADRAEECGIDLPPPQADTLQTLRRLVPEYGSPGNPCDMTAQVLATPTHQIECFDALLTDPQYGALVVPHTYAYAPVIGRIAQLDEAAARRGKIACNVWLTQHLEGPGAAEAEAHAHVATFRSMRHCMQALAAWHRRDDWLQRQDQPRHRSAPPSAAADAAAWLTASPHATLTERESKAVLAAYGIATVRDMLVHDPAQAAAAAQTVGLPVVLKIASPDIPHKTEAGGVRLNLRTTEEVRAAFGDIIARAKAWSPTARIDGVVVQPMVPPGTEIMVGGRVDPQFGPMVVVGLGGVFVELLRDVAVRPAPVGLQEARSMLGELKAQQALQGFRGAAPVDLDRLADVIMRVSELMDDLRDVVAEVDVNPLVCDGARIVAVDALVLRAMRAA
jgi:acyl-CoA synthetase (NDP forming)